jgi:hypothetical protein
MQTYMEPVTTYHTSYRLEPVTTYKYTSYYDPCTGCCRQVCTPCVSYRLRAQCNAVQSFVQRCALVPYTVQRQSCYLEPVVTYAPPPPCPDPCPPVGLNGVAPVPAPVPAPGAGITESPGAPPRMPIIGDPNRNLPPQNIPELQKRSAPRPNPIRIDRTTSRFASAGNLHGMVVRDDRITPRGNAKMLFVSVEKQGPQETATTDSTGRFDVALKAGEWLMYVAGEDGKPEYHSKLTVQASDDRVVTIVSR